MSAGAEGPAPCQPEVMLRRARGLARALSFYAGVTMTPAAVRLMAMDVGKLLAVPESAAPAVAGMIKRHWAESVPDNRALVRFALKLMAVHADLRAGRLPATWNGHPPTWTCVRVTGVERLADKRDAHTVAMVALTGIMAGDELLYTLSARHMFMLARQTGATRWGELAPRDLLGFDMNVLVGIGATRKEAVIKVVAGPAMFGRNRKLYRKRHPGGR